MRVLILLLVITVGISCTCQTKDKPDIENKVYQFAEVMPSSNLTESELFATFAKEIEYPSDSSTWTVRSKTTISFVVNAKGEIESAEVLEEASLDAKVGLQMIAIVKSLKWTPGMINGKPVAVRLNYPLRIHLQ